MVKIGLFKEKHLIFGRVNPSKQVTKYLPNIFIVIHLL